jgi:arylsulfatase A-like enzyme
VFKFIHFQCIIKNKAFCFSWFSSFPSLPSVQFLEVPIISIPNENHSMLKSHSRHRPPPMPAKLLSPIPLILAACGPLVAKDTGGAVPPPNIIYILADDLGYGDVRVFNPESKIRTPHLDGLAAQGMIFTNAHSSSAVCTPTRYGIMTGRYNWRTPLQREVIGGLSPLLLEKGRLTVPQLLKNNGYDTACIGKWHLGMDWTVLPGRSVTRLNIETPEQYDSVDYEKPVLGGPVSSGFDYFFGISGSLDMVPYAYMENDRLVARPTDRKRFPIMAGRDKSWTRLGPAVPGFEARDVMPELTRRAVDYIMGRGSKSPHGKQGARPFFLYFPLTAPHAPIAPSDDWLGRSGLNPYADFVMELDWSVGRILRALDETGLARDTLVIFTSDNGTAPQADIKELNAGGHRPNYIYRGLKMEIYEGGHRIPFIARWPARIKARGGSSELICLNDLMATCADMLGMELPPDAGEDSVSILPVLLGKSCPPVHEAVVHHSRDGSFAITQGAWKLVLTSGDGNKRPPGSRDSTPRLFDLSTDSGEAKEVTALHPGIVEKLTALLERYIKNGRSTPGPRQHNDVDVDWRALPATP